MIVCGELNSNLNTTEWIGAVVEEGTREDEVSSSNPTDRVARDFTRKNARLETGGVGLPYIKIFFFSYF